MRIIIVGCGKVGSSIASELNLEGHEISVVDINHGAVDKLANSLDVLGIEGNGATYDVLIEAGAEYADLLIAATARDEINLPDIEMGVVSVQADEMTFETTTEPVTDFRLGKSEVEFHVIGKFPGIITTVQSKSEITP